MAVSATRFYKNFSVPNKINKNITLVASGAAEQLVEPVDDYDLSLRVDPDFNRVQGFTFTGFDSVNYLLWDSAFYFIESITFDLGFYTVNCTMDLLMTYKSAIKSLRIQGGRSSTHGSPRAADNSRLVSSDGERIVTAWPTAISGAESDGLYVLTTSQGSYS